MQNLTQGYTQLLIIDRLTNSSVRYTRAYQHTSITMRTKIKKMNFVRVQSFYFILLVLISILFYANQCCTYFIWSYFLISFAQWPKMIWRPSIFFSLHSLHAEHKMWNSPFCNHIMVYLPCTLLYFRLIWTMNWWPFQILLKFA